MKTSSLSPWLKRNWLLVLIALFLLVIVIKLQSPWMSRLLGLSMKQGTQGAPSMMSAESDMTYAPESRMIAPMPPLDGSSTNLNMGDRKVVQNVSFSLLVKNVRETVVAITQQVTSVGGIMVSSSVSSPEEGGSGWLSLRVPNDKLQSTLDFLRGAGVRVVSEDVSGYDVTDQFQDLTARLQTLEITKQKFDVLFDQANTVEEILKVQQSLLDLQNQIDSVKGQQQYLENTANSVLISVNLSTDELSLPYSPTDPWRPQVIFKTAVRSLVTNLRDLASIAIWAAVYAPVFLVIAGVALFGYWMMRKTQAK